MTSPTLTPAPAESDDPRPAIFKLGVGLLALHELMVIAVCAIGGLLGAFGILFGSLSAPDSGGIGLVVLVGALAAILLMMGVGLAVLSLVVGFLAWSGSRFWLQALIVVALLNCVLVMPNPLGILAAILCVLGSLQYLENLAAAGARPGAVETTTDSQD